MPSFRTTAISGSEDVKRNPKAKVLDFAQRAYSRGAEVFAGAGSKIKEEFTSNPNAVLWKGIFAGLVAGLAATAAMTAFQAAWSVKERLENPAAHNPQNASENNANDESSTVKAANALSKGLLNRQLRKDEKEHASKAVHFAFGTLVGGVYGISSEYLPVARLGNGLFHGLALWMAADAIAIPTLGWSSPVSERSAAELAYEILAHAVYGVSSEAARKIVRARLG